MMGLQHFLHTKQVPTMITPLWDCGRQNQNKCRMIWRNIKFKKESRQHTHNRIRTRGDVWRILSRDKEARRVMAQALKTFKPAQCALPGRIEEYYQQTIDPDWRSKYIGRMRKGDQHPMKWRWRRRQGEEEKAKRKRSFRGEPRKEGKSVTPES